MATIFGIRHHGPGCALSLQAALDRLSPDMVLLEGPPDAQDQIVHAAAEGMRPPVALLVYAVDTPKRAAFYPFAEFSPEWQAIRWALSRGVEIRFNDLPCAVRFGQAEADEQRRAEAPPGDSPPQSDEVDTSTAEPEEHSRDPLAWLARADGYTDSERWWNDRIEEGRDDAELFQAILEGLTTLRAELDLPETEESLQREASMRQSIRKAEKDGAENIAVVCGAWHAPVLTDDARAEIKKTADAKLLRGLKKAKVRATWTPWTFRRLTMASGYGAGITSPRWYEQIFRAGNEDRSRNPGDTQQALLVRWLVLAARIYRKNGLDASSASAIEAVRLAESLASLRGRPRPGLDESLEAIASVFAHGDETALEVVRPELAVGNRIGTLPEGTAQLPLEQDIQRQQKSLRLKQSAAHKEINLDLREPGGQKRSVFLHRLRAIQVHWGEVQGSSGRSRGTFKEIWTIVWEPELALAIVDASAFGNTLEDATNAALLARGAKAELLADRIELLELALTADAQAATTGLLQQVETASATTHDASTLLRAVPPLSRIQRYGTVRTFDQAAIAEITRSLITRTHLALPKAFSGLSDDAATEHADLLRDYHAALAVLDDPELRAAEYAALLRITDQDSAHPMLRGLACRLLHEASKIDVRLALGRELSRGSKPLDAAHWIDGLLRGSGTYLAHDRELLRGLEAWIETLPDEAFLHVLPLVRRTFGTFTSPERSQVASGLRTLNTNTPAQAFATAQLDPKRTQPVVHIAMAILGLDNREDVS